MTETAKAVHLKELSMYFGQCSVDGKQEQDLQKGSVALHKRTNHIS